MFARTIVPASLGTVRSAVRLGGMGGGEVYRVALERKEIIAKKINHPVEVYFYEDVAPDLRRFDLATPKLLAHVKHDDETWLLLEAVPVKMSRDDWNSRDIVEYLARLHSVSPHNYRLPGPRKQWTEEMNETALAYFSQDTRAPMAEAFRDLARRYNHLFDSDHLISGDCNIENWGRDHALKPVLFDWERVGTGSPALDLATLVPGFPPFNVLEAFARSYSVVVTGVPPNAHLLAQSIVASIVWTVVDMYWQHHAGKIALTPDVIAYCSSRLPGWIATMSV